MISNNYCKASYRDCKIYLELYQFSIKQFEDNTWYSIQDILDILPNKIKQVKIKGSINQDLSDKKARYKLTYHITSLVHKELLEAKPKILGSKAFLYRKLSNKSEFGLKVEEYVNIMSDRFVNHIENGDGTIGDIITEIPMKYVGTITAMFQMKHQPVPKLFEGNFTIKPHLLIKAQRCGLCYQSITTNNTKSNIILETGFVCNLEILGLDPNFVADMQTKREIEAYLDDSITELYSDDTGYQELQILHEENIPWNRLRKVYNFIHDENISYHNYLRIVKWYTGLYHNECYRSRRRFADGEYSERLKRVKETFPSKADNIQYVSQKSLQRCIKCDHTLDNSVWSSFKIDRTGRNDNEVDYQYSAYNSVSSLPILPQLTQEIEKGGDRSELSDHIAQHLQYDDYNFGRKSYYMWYATSVYLDRKGLLHERCGK